jgi:hypothetical protein
VTLSLPHRHDGWRKLMLDLLRRRLSAPLRGGLTETPGAERYRKYHAQETPHVKGVSLMVGVAISINLIMGSGFLALPKAIVNAGLVLSSAVIVSCALIMTITISYEVEAMARAEAWIKDMKKNINRPPPKK